MSTEQATLQETATIACVDVNGTLHARRATTTVENDGESKQVGLAACSPAIQGEPVEIPCIDIDGYDTCNAPACPGGDRR